MKPLKRTLPRPPRAQAGATMIEVLVAILIFSFGMLGLAGLQVKTMTYTQSSLMRSQATALTDDLLDRMRADRLKARKTEATADSWNTQFAVHADAITGNSDLSDWKKELESLLSEGEAEITVATGGDVTVVIRWTDARTEKEDADKTQSFTTVTRL
jgi:type IV pilus assembly protein PilV